MTSLVVVALSFCCFLAPVAHALAPATCNLRLFNSHNAATCNGLQRTVLLRAAISPDEVAEEKQEDAISQNERAEKLRQLRRVALARRRQAITEQEDEERDRKDKSFLALALVPCVLAFASWEELSMLIAKFTDTYGADLGTEYGTQFANNLLRPTITGVVVPVASIAFATLLSTTVSVLRQRQVDLRVLLNKEACGELLKSSFRLNLLNCSDHFVLTSSDQNCFATVPSVHINEQICDYYAGPSTACLARGNMQEEDQRRSPC